VSLRLTLRVLHGPVTRGLDDVARRRRLVQATGRRFRVVGWIALALVVPALALSAVHDFVLGPRAGRPDLPPSARVQASWLARVELVVVLVTVALGLALRG